MRVLVSGAGIAGPTLAWWLSRFGARVTVVEKASSMLAQGQNIDVHGTALNVIHKMGLLEEIRKHNTTEKGTCFVDPRGNYFAHFPVEGSAGSPTSPFEILRGDLADVLYNAAKSLPDVEFRFGTTISEVVENSQEKVKVKLSTGEEEEYDVLVAADGQWSRVRKQVFAQDAVQVVDKNCFCVYATIPREKDDTEYWRVYQGLGSRGLSTRPDNHGTTRAMFTCMPLTAEKKQAWMTSARSHDRKSQLQLLNRELGDMGWIAPRVLKEMETADDLYFQAIQQIRMTKWHNSRVICLGDAAYAPSPFTGMGTSLAIVGAYLLAGHLSKLQRLEHPGKAFEVYEQEFRPFVQKIQEVPWFVPGIAHPRAAWARWLFRRLVSTMAYIVTIPWIARKYGPQGKKFENGLVDDLDAPFPEFAAFQADQAVKA